MEVVFLRGAYFHGCEFKWFLFLKFFILLLVAKHTKLGFHRVVPGCVLAESWNCKYIYETRRDDRSLDKTVKTDKEALL